MQQVLQSIVQSPPQSPQSTWIQAVSHLDPRYGGIASMLGQLCEHSQQAGVSSPVIGFCDEGEYAQRTVGNATEVTIAPRDRLQMLFNTKLRQRLKDQMRHASGVHIHGIWEGHCATAAGWARDTRRPYIVSAHGMLDRWALKQKRFKKAVYSTLVESRNLSHASCLRALTPAEAQDYRRLGLRAPIAIVPNGVTVPEQMDSTEFLSLYPQLEGKRVILFMGRLHPKKGLIPLVEAWLQVRREQAHLVIAGPDDGLRSTLEQMIRDGSASCSVTLAGNLSGSMKWSALASASLFALPSYSEGLSVALLEALAVGVPVLFTPQCNLPEAAREAGWLIDAEQAQIESALREFLNTRAEQMRSMACTGRKLAARHFHWDIVADQMKAVYRWLEGGACPNNVDVV